MWFVLREHNGRFDASESSRPPLGRSIASAFASVLALIAAFAFIDTHWLSDAGARLHSYQQLIGLFAALLAAVTSVRLVLRGSPSLFARASPVEDDDALSGAETPASRAHRIARFAEWFILMRWLAALMAVLLIFVAIDVMGYLPPGRWGPLTMAIGTLVLLNIAYTHLLATGATGAPLLEAQAYGDLVILTTLLHFSGGIENPLTTLMVFHVIIAGIILDRWQCYHVAAAAAVLFAVLAFGEYSGLLSHYPLGIVPHSARAGVRQDAALDEQFVVARVALHAAVLLLTAYFATSVVDELRRGQRERRRVEVRAQRSEKLAAIGGLAGRVAHEVNNPVAIISAKARLLLSDHRGDLSVHAFTELGKIVELADRIASIAQGLLAYVRPSTISTAPQPLRSLVQKVLAIVAPSAHGAGVDIDERIPDGLAPVRVNAGEMEQVFLNLFLNALDAMPGGGVLSVTAYEDIDGAGGSWVCVIVADTGCGIAPEIRARMFEPFHTTKPEGKGTGLGLSICLGLVTSNGGTMEVDSSVGEGTRMRLRLPIASEARLPTPATSLRAGVT